MGTPKNSFLLQKVLFKFCFLLLKNYKFSLETQFLEIPLFVRLKFISIFNQSF